MKLEESIKKYLENSLVMKSRGTYEFEKVHLNALFSYLGDVSLNQINFYDLIRLMKQKGLSNNTINKRIGLMKRLLKFFNFEFENIPKLRENNNRFDYLSALEIKRIKKYLLVNLNYNSLLSIRNTQIMFVFIDTGIRLSELMALKKTDYNANLGLICLKKTKNHKERIVYLSSFTNELLKNFSLKGHYLFGCKLTYSIIRRIFEKVKKDLNLKKFSSHVLRHSLATNMLKNGAGIEDVANILGHSNYNITRIYLHLDDEYMREKYDLIYPY
ncbi:MAG TPA: tyrosine-type recombinase/integrase [Acholeplasmataceae bacterium]|nr:tyrosine-type recombinase/integrase [Acholeplasmataceae bacterium]